MKVLHIVYSGTGGASNVVFSLIEGDIENKLDQQILFTGPIFNKDYNNIAKKLNVSYKWIKTTKLFSFYSYFSVFKNLFKLRPSSIIIHNFLIIPCVFYKILNPNVKIIYVNHTPAKLFAWKDSFIVLFNYFIDKYILLNLHTLSYYKKKFSHISKKKTVYITNGINLNYYKSYKKKKNKFFKIGMACRVNKLKKYNMILDALKTKRLSNRKIKFSLAGSGEELDSFKKRVSRYKLKNKVIIEGYLNQNRLKKWFNSIDLYVQASKDEGMSISILQALAMKCLVIGSNVPGISSILGKKKYVGMLFKNNVEDLSKKIEYFFLLNKYKKDKFRTSQYSYITEHHNHKIIFGKYYSLIKTKS